MYLIFPKSMIIPEVADRSADNNFEDWLTAAVIENASQQEPNAVPSSRGITDLWMLEIAKRTGKIWQGEFHVEFNQEADKAPKNGNALEEGTAVFSFSLDTATGEMRFTP